MTPKKVTSIRPAPEKTELEIRFIPITCAAPLLYAHSHGLFERNGLQVNLKPAPGWSGIKELIVYERVDAVHMLSPMPLACTLGIDGKQERITLAGIQNVNGQALTLAQRYAGLTDVREMKGFTFGVPYRFSMHYYLLADFLASQGLDPLHDVTIQEIAPPRMPYYLEKGWVDGFFSPDPYNQIAVNRGIGFLYLLSRDLWPGHPCCSFALRQDFIERYPQTYQALLKSVLEAELVLHQADAEQRRAIAREISAPQYLNVADSLAVEQVLSGHFPDGRGGEQLIPDRIDFIPHPWPEYGTWILTQMQRWGQLKRLVDYQAVVESVFSQATHATAAESGFVAEPASPPQLAALLADPLPVMRQQPFSAFQEEPTPAGYELSEATRHRLQQIVEGLADVAGGTPELRLQVTANDEIGLLEQILRETVQNMRFTQQALLEQNERLQQVLTEHQRAEEALHQSQERYQTLFEHANDAIFIENERDEIVEVNARACELLGYTREELLRMSVPDLQAPEVRAQAGKAIRTEVQEHKGQTFEGLDLHKDGRRIPVEISNSPLGNTGQVVSIVRDITERKRAEREREELYQRRAYQVQVGVEIAQEIAAAADLNQLFSRVVTLVKERFGYYHVQIFRSELALNAVVVVTGYGEPGRQLLAVGHRLPFGRGVVGTAAATGQPVLVTDVAQDPDWRPNPYLPATRGELAVPIKFQDQVLGILDVQSEHVGALTADDQLLLEGLCGQIAVAIADTRLRQEMEERLTELNTLYRAMSREGWTEFRATTVLPGGYLYDGTTLQPATEESLPSLQGITGPTAARLDSGQTVTVTPLTVRGGEVVGTLGVYDDPRQPLTPDDLLLVEEVSEQVALALENARLLAQTQRTLAATEALYQVSADLNKVQTYADILAVLRTHTLLGWADLNVSLNIFDHPWEKDQTSPWVEVAARWSRLPAERIASRYNLAGFPAVQLLQPDQALIVGDVAHDPRLDEASRHLYRDVFLGAATVFVPLVVAGQWIGYINAIYSQVTQFPEADVRRLMVVVEQAAVALQGLRQFERVQTSLSEAEMLYAASARLNAAQTYEEVLTALRESTVLEQADRAVTLALFNRPWVKQDRPEWVVPIAIWPVEVGPQPKRFPLPASPGVSSQALELPLLFSDIATDPRLTDEHRTRLIERFGARSLLLVPLIVGGEQIGMLQGMFSTTGTFSETELRRLNALAGQAAVVVRSLEQREQMRQRAAQLEALSRLELALSQANDEAQILAAVAQSLPADPELTMGLFYLETETVGDQALGTTMAIWQEGAIAPDSPLIGRPMDLRGLTTAQFWSQGTAEAVFVADVATDPSLDEPVRQAYRRMGTGAAALLPLWMAGRWQGVVSLIWSQPHEFSADERFILEQILDPLAALVASRRAFVAQQQARAELERRAVQLQTAAEISRAASSILNLEELLPQAVELIRQRFDLYYAGIFLVDEAGRWAILRAGTGEAGQIMLTRNHKLEVGGTSMIGTCVARREARIALDVGTEAVRFDNPVLPETRSEMALPLISQGRVIGAMTIQDRRPAAFGPEDITILQTMADQLANAIQNARLLQETQQSLRQVQLALGRTTQESWRAFTAGQLRGYRYRGLEVETAATTTPEAEQAWRQGRTVAVQVPAPSGTQNGSGNKARHAVAVPIKYRAQVIGVLNLHSERESIPQELITLMEAIANRLAIALDNARLLEETRQRVAREQALSQITARFSRSLDMEAMLQSAVRELGQLPRVTEVSIHLGVPAAAEAAPPPAPDHASDEEAQP